MFYPHLFYNSIDHSWMTEWALNSELTIRQYLIDKREYLSNNIAGVLCLLMISVKWIIRTILRERKLRKHFSSSRLYGVKFCRWFQVPGSINGCCLLACQKNKFQFFKAKQSHTEVNITSSRIIWYSTVLLAGYLLTQLVIQLERYVAIV